MLNQFARTAAVAAAIASLALPGRTAPTVRRITYLGWANCYAVTNGFANLVYVPQLGRIMRYGLVTGPNMLWVNPALQGTLPNPNASGWQNFGGDKLWPAPQSVWGWPPDQTIDSGGVTALPQANGSLLIHGKESANLGIRFDRLITLDASGSGVTIVNTLVNMKSTAVTWSIWEVAQVNDPADVRMPLSTTGRFPGGYYTFPGPTPDKGSVTIVPPILLIKRGAKTSLKVGTDSPIGPLRADRGGYWMGISMAREAGGDYPDNNCNLEVYTNPDPLKYCEMELLGPIRTIPAQRTITFTTHWKLGKL